MLNIAHYDRNANQKYNETLPHTSQNGHHQKVYKQLMLERASIVGQLVKNLPAMQETQVQSLGRKDPLEKREWQPIPVFLPGESHGQRILAGYSLCSCKHQT